MKLKSINVNITNLCNELKEEIPIIEKKLKLMEGKSYVMTITSGNDGKHMKRSLHYENKAIDIRIWDMKYPNGNWLMIKKHLGKDFDVILEKTHIHIEYDPK
jgi:hypothetical protein